jgi:hypothetical protein
VGGQNRQTLWVVHALLLEDAEFAAAVVAVAVVGALARNERLMRQRISIDVASCLK